MNHQGSYKSAEHRKRTRNKFEHFNHNQSVIRIVHCVRRNCQTTSHSPWNTNENPSHFTYLVVSFKPRSYFTFNSFLSIISFTKFYTNSFIHSK